jgi:hypothetical protein
MQSQEHRDIGNLGFLIYTYIYIYIYIKKARWLRATNTTVGQCLSPEISARGVHLSQVLQDDAWLL